MSGAGLAAFGFWLFIGAIVVAGIWYDARRRESQQETLRRIVESGRDIDPAIIDRVVGVSEARKQAQDLRVAAFIVLPMAPGMAIFAYFIGMVSLEARSALLGVSFLMAFIGAGLFMAARYVDRQNGNAA